MRLDLTHIQRWIEPESRVLDLGCGNGEFLQLLRDERQVRGTGIEIDEHEITSAIARGLNIVEQNLDQGLANFPDQSFDTVVMAHALQAVHFPDRALTLLVILVIAGFPVILVLAWFFDITRSGIRKDTSGVQGSSEVPPAGEGASSAAYRWVLVQNFLSTLEDRLPSN